ncbi:unnamed protein product [Rangifer tarandus platyrhynchus]|uniref:Uncharacterized protein n=2 Tax=Rangifer tarandus platyrhynchus TaxID=3082113 RepID=A0ABN8YLC7_RANTA|nr:unnamed protein product [Rangifer tarandus platyrhynchus]
MRDGCPIQPLGVRSSSLVGQSRTVEAAGKRGAGGIGGANKGERTGTAAAVAPAGHYRSAGLHTVRAGGQRSHIKALCPGTRSVAHLTLTFREQASCALEKDEAEA